MATSATVRFRRCMRASRVRDFSSHGRGRGAGESNRACCGILDGACHAVEEPPPELERAREPVDEGCGRRERRAALHRVARDADTLPEADEELGMRDVAAGDAAGLLLVEALRELDPLPGVRTARMQRAHGARELAHLEEELHGERAEGGAREPSLRDAAPEWMAAEGAARVDHRP